jgi:DNA repair exonuclease SbcCD ATPase subunit
MRAGERARKLERKLTDIEGEIRGLETSFGVLREAIVLSKKELKKWGVGRRKQLDEMRMLIEEKSTLRGHYTREVNAMKAKATEAAKQLGEVEAKLVIAREDLDRFDKKQQAEKTQWDIHQAYIARLRQELVHIDKAKLCPTCKQPIKQADRSEHKKELKRTIKSELAKQAKIVLDTKGREKLLDAFQEARVKISSRLPNYESATKALAQLQRLKDQAQAQLEAHKRQSQQLADEINPHKKQLAKLREQRAELKATRGSLMVRSSKLSKRLERTKPWIKGFKDVRLLTLEEVLAELEISTNALLDDLGLTDWSMHFYVERETKSGSVQTGMGVTIASPEHKEPVKWESWSGGEGQRLRLAGALALSEVLLNHAGIETNLEILDEPSRSLASSEDLIEALAERAERLQRRILYVDHLATDNSQFASTVTIVKTKEGSHIQM